MFKKISLSVCILSNMILSATVLDTKEVKPDGYVLLIATTPSEVDAIDFANKLPNENIYIFKDNDKYTVRIVNIESLNMAKDKLKEVKKVFPDAIHWKKMTFLKQPTEASKIDTNATKVIAVKPNEKMIFESGANGEVTTQLIFDTKVYSAPAPYGKQKDEFKKGYFVKGVLNEKKDWFVIMKISTNKNTWFDIPSPLWMDLNNTK